MYSFFYIDQNCSTKKKDMEIFQYVVYNQWFQLNNLQKGWRYNKLVISEKARKISNQLSTSATHIVSAVIFT